MERQVPDLQHSRAVITQMLRPQRATALQGTYTSGQLLLLMKHFEFAVGVRLHFLMFAALQSVPFVALPYASKILGFLENLEIEMPPLKLVNLGRLIAHIDKSWGRRTALRLQIERVLPAMREQAMSANNHIVKILRNLPSPTPPAGKHRRLRQRGKMPSLEPPPEFRTIALKPRSARFAGETDVLVVGGGPAGLGAALGARWSGSRVILAERYGFLGGNATNALVMPIASCHTSSREKVPRDRAIFLFSALETCGFF